MPHLLNWQTAAIAAGLVIPSLLLLYFLKLRRREMAVPSTFLWKKSIQDLQVNAPFQRLRRNLLLLLQMLLLLFLLLALARPVMNYSPGAGKLAVIMLDRSASMAARDVDGKSRLDDAKRRANELVDTLDKNGSAMVVAFDDSAEIVRSFTSDRVSLRNAIDSIRPTDRPSHLKTAFQLAEAKAMAFYPDELRPQGIKPELWLFSDGRIADREELTLRGADLKYTRVGSDDAHNLAIVALNARRNYERPAEVQVFVRLANHGPEPASAVLQLSVDGQVPPGGVKRGLMLIPERWSQQQRDKAQKEEKLFHQGGAEFTLELMKSATIRIDLLEQTSDMLAADDTAQVVVPPPRAMSVLLVTTSGNLWLEKFIQSANLKDPGIVAPSAFEEMMKDPQAVASKYDIIMFDRYRPKELPPAGNFIYFAVVPPDPQKSADPKQPEPPHIKAAKDADGPILLKDQLVLDWERDHPMLRGLNLRIYAKEALRLQVPTEAQVLVDGRKGPMVALHREGRRTHLVVAFDVQESTWPTSPTFPIFFDNALQYLALGAEMDVRQSYPPGSTPRIPRHNIQQAGGEVKRVKITGPAGFSATVPVPEAGDFALPSLDRVGLYELDPPIPQFDRIAVNLLDDNESNLLPIDEEPGGVGEAINVNAKAGRSRYELWWWIVAFGAIPLCLIEWWVYTRRVHL